MKNVGYSGKQQINRLLQTAPSKIDLAFGATSLIRVLDAAAAQHAGLRGYDYETLSALSSLVPTSTLAAGVRLQPETIEGPSAHRSIPSPFVAEIAVVDNRIQPVYGTEGLIHAIHANREVLRSGTALAGRMFDGIQDTPALLRDMAIPAEEVILLTTRGIDSFM